jgi:rhodanese-related sulfurtransferase
MMDAMRISVDEVRRRINRGDDILFVDSRSPASWAASTEKIVGAIRVPPDDVADHVGSIPQGRSLITYCT